MKKIKFPERLKELREERKLSMNELAREVGTYSKTISCWERGITVPNIEYIATLCQFFGCTSDYLIGLRDD